MLLPNLSSADTVVLSFSNDRQYELAGYLFLPTSTTGTSTIDGIEADIDLSLSDALDLLDVAASFRAESWKGDWGLIFDANYLSLEANENLSRGGSVDGDVEQYWLAFLGTYRVSRGTLSGGQPYSIDVQAGVRYNSLKQKINISGPGTSLGGTETWWEPVIGARYAWKINEKWSGAVLADAGGFGVNDSDLQWSTTLSFDYSFDGARSLKLGVRYYSIDFSTNRPGGEFAYDASQVGPFIGYSYSF
ncbi:hypothetical protein [Roseovarius albus]|nr:hypothetical protein [Roseovarius albus]